MKKILSIAVIILATFQANAQTADRKDNGAILIPAPAMQAKPKDSKPLWANSSATIAFQSKENLAVLKKCNVVGTMGTDVVLEAESGELLLVTTDGKVSQPEDKKMRWTPLVPKPQTPIKIIGTTTEGAPVLKSGEKNYLMTQGKMVDYIGHVTLLK